MDAKSSNNLLTFNHLVPRKFHGLQYWLLFMNHWPVVQAPLERPCPKVSQKFKASHIWYRGQYWDLSRWPSSSRWVWLSPSGKMCNYEFLTSIRYFQISGRIPPLTLGLTREKSVLTNTIVNLFEGAILWVGSAGVVLQAHHCPAHKGLMSISWLVYFTKDNIKGVSFTFRIDNGTMSISACVPSYH
jgi:hypothetical protein